VSSPPQTDELLTEIERNTRDTAAAVTAAAAPAGAVVVPVGSSVTTGRRVADGAIVVTPAGQVVMKPTSTEEEDRHTAGQRTVNLLWENTQRQIALAVTASSVAVSGYLAILGSTDQQTAAMVFLFGVANLITGFYFGRTNHQRVGGVQQGR
jgi:putative Mn2+ efflux pump MntP